jgi:hypothetical protein
MSIPLGPNPAYREACLHEYSSWGDIPVARQHGMARTQAADGEDCRQIWRMHGNILK